MLTHVGTLSLGECVPMAFGAQAKLAASIALVLPDIEARIAGLLALQVELAIKPPSLAADLEVALELAASIRASIELGWPGIELDLSLVVGLLLELQLSLGKLQIDLAFALSLQLVLGSPGVHMYTLDGRVGDVIPGGVPGGTGPEQQGYGVVLVGVDSGAIAALKTLFGRS